jgi:hypothetical protein
MVAALAKVPCSIESTPALGEGLAETLVALAEDSAGGVELDHVGAELGRFAHLGGAFVGTGAGVVAVERGGDFRAEAGDVAMATDGRKRLSRRKHSRSGNEAFVERPAKGEAVEPARAEVANGGESGADGDERVVGADERVPLFRIGRLAPERLAGHPGEVDVGVDQARKDGLAAEVDQPRVGGRGGQAVGDCGDPAVGDGDGRRARGRLRGVGDEVPGMDDDGLGGGGRGGEKAETGKQPEAHRGPLDGSRLTAAPPGR